MSMSEITVESVDKIKQLIVQYPAIQQVLIMLANQPTITYNGV